MTNVFIYSFLLALPLASAIPWVGPEPTKAHNPGQQLGWTPKPTPEPALLFGIYELRKRQAFASTSSFVHGTCGFLLGAADNPLTCVNSGYSCAIDSQHNVFGCCSSLAECTLGTTCIPQAALSSCDSACVANPYIVKCNPTSPFCNQFLLVEATGTNTASNWYCDDSPTIATEYAVATDSTKPSASYAALTQSIPSSASTSSSVTTSSSAVPSSTSSFQGSTTITVPASPTSTSASPTPTHSPTPVGPIVGGVVGGLVVIAALILGIIYFRRRGRNTREPAPAPAPGPGLQPQVAPAGGYYVPQQPAIAEKEAPLPTVQQPGQRAEMYSPPQSPAPQYSPVHQNQPAPNTLVYPNLSEMDATAISPHAAPGSY